jgi:hypothetical protein
MARCRPGNLIAVRQAGQDLHRALLGACLGVRQQGRAGAGRDRAVGRRELDRQRPHVARTGGRPRILGTCLAAGQGLSARRGYGQEVRVDCLYHLSMSLNPMMVDAARLL